jgi:hypothetical protein
MSEPKPDLMLGSVVVELARAAAERWVADDLDGAEILAAGAWRLCTDHRFIDRESSDAPADS